ncbi:PAP2 superfamily domain-containing protein [Neurospora intermedia]|uniref:PAP2 superfamily domain-containing protein n=1 Tax=Neurospora intermedia TaxID=5142 RepID=A0ABR3DQE5_NEUIN
MAIGAILEPGIVVGLLAGGTLVNRNTTYTSSTASSRRASWHPLDQTDPEALPSASLLNDEQNFEGGRKAKVEEDEYNSDSRRPWSPSRSSSSSTVVENQAIEKDLPYGKRFRTLKFMGWEREVVTPNTEIHRDRLLSRVLRKFPFLVEVWYWALIYWVYQLGRAFTAVTLKASTVDTAREHALQIIHMEQRLRIFVEPIVQGWFLGHPTILKWTNRTYSFIHIPGTILFLIVLFYVTTTRPRARIHENHGGGALVRDWRNFVNHFGPDVYERRRRTMAMCNLLAFIVFTFWPCMPPRLLSDPTYNGEDAKEAKSYGFVDTVHGKDGDSSVWTTNKFCNQYAAMPSLHFGYSFLIGLTIATVPLRRQGRFGWKRLVAIFTGMVYPAIILTAIVATANHFVLDAVAGACACLIAWKFNHVLLNLLPIEDWFLHVLRMHKPN